MTFGSEFQVFRLSEGRAVKFESEFFEFAFTYDGNGYKSSWEYESLNYVQEEALGKWTVVDGNPVEYYEIEYCETYPDNKTTFKFTMDSERQNNINYNLYALFAWDWSPVNFLLNNLNIGGKRYRNLPSEIVMTDTYGTSISTISYKMDGEYISGITIRHTDEDGEMLSSTDI